MLLKKNQYLLYPVVSERQQPKKKTRKTEEHKKMLKNENRTKCSQPRIDCSALTAMPILSFIELRLSSNANYECKWALAVAHAQCENAMSRRNEAK